MANCSIPNSIPATGRISTPSSRRSKKQNDRAEVSVIQRSVLNACARSIGICCPLRVQKRRQAAALQSAFRARRVPRSTFDVRRSAFSFLWRVKGAWWPSRSSKPSSLRKWQGRFDSYPLRQFFHIVILRRAQRSRRIPWRYREIIHRDFSTSLGMTSASKGGEPHVA